MTARETRIGWIVGIILALCIAFVAGVEGGAFVIIGNSGVA